MTEDSQSGKVAAKQKNPNKSWLEKLGDAFTGEPQDRDQVLALLRDAEQRDLLDKYALSMMEGVIEVMEDQVRDVMIPRSHMVIVEHDAQMDDILRVVTTSGHSRFPVIGESKDEVIGILLAKDLLQFTVASSKDFDFLDIVRPAVFIPESKRLNTLLKEFRASRNHMAIVVDEYGGVAGLVTIEDVLEQIVGEIADEHDTEEDQNIKPCDETQYIVKALTGIEEFNAYFDVEFDDEEFDTIGGFILRQLGHMPKRGEEMEFHGFNFKVLGADSRRIHRLLVRRKETEAADRSLAQE